MSLVEQLQHDLKSAMLAKDKARLSALRLISAAVKQVEVDERIRVDDARMLVILDKLAKQRRESITQFSKAERHDLVAQEQFELDILLAYLPKPLSDEEAQVIVTTVMQELGASTIADMGKIMAQVKPQLQGRYDLAKVNQIIKAKLG